MGHKVAATPVYFNFASVDASKMKTMQNGQIPQGQTIIINQQATPKSNGMGVAGFVLALIAAFFGWIPVLGWILWVLGLIFSFVGIFKRPRGLAIAGLVISMIGLVLLLVVFGVIMAAVGSAAAIAAI